MSDQQEQKGAAAIRIALANGDVTVRHAEENTLIRHYKDVPAGSWFEFFDAMDKVFENPNPPDRTVIDIATRKPK